MLIESYPMEFDSDFEAHSCAASFAVQRTNVHRMKSHAAER